MPVTKLDVVEDALEPGPPKVYSPTTRLENAASIYFTGTGDEDEYIDRLCAKYDSNGDGVFDKGEVKSMLKDFKSVKGKNSLYTYIIGVGAVMYIITLLAMLGVCWAAVNLSKESHVEGDVMVSATTGKAVQCASSDLALDGSGLIDRHTLRPIETATPSKQHALSSRVPDRYMSELEGFSYEADGIAQYVKVTSWKRVAQQDAQCGSVVILTTQHGDFTLDDAHLYHNGGALTVTGEFSYDGARRLSHRGRRLTDMAQGLFKFIEESEFECVQTWNGQEEKKELKQPVAPYSYVMKTTHDCMVDGVNECMSTNGATSYKAKPGSSVDMANITTLSRVLVTRDNRTVTLSYMANHPMQVDVTVNSPIEGSSNESVYKYQLFIGSTGDESNVGQHKAQKTYCHLQEDEPSTSFNASEMFMSFLGVIEEQGQRYRKFSVTPKDEDLASVLNFEVWDREADHTLYQIKPMGPAADLLGQKPLLQSYHDMEDQLSDEAVDEWLQRFLPVEDPLVAVSGAGAVCNELTSSVTVKVYEDGGRGGGRSVVVNNPPMSSALSESDTDFYLTYYTLNDVLEMRSYLQSTYEAYWELLAAHAKERKESMCMSKPQQPYNQSSRRLSVSSGCYYPLNMIDDTQEDEGLEFDTPPATISMNVKHCIDHTHGDTLGLEVGFVAKTTASSCARIKAGGLLKAELCPFKEGKMEANVNFKTGQVTAEGEMSMGYEAYGCGMVAGVAAEISGKIGGSFGMGTATDGTETIGLKIFGKLFAEAAVKIKGSKGGSKCKCKKYKARKGCKKNWASASIKGEFSATLEAIAPGQWLWFRIGGKIEASLRFLGVSVTFKIKEDNILKHQIVQL